MKRTKFSERNPDKPTKLIFRIFEFLLLGASGIYILQTFGKLLPLMSVTVILPLFLIGSQKSRSELLKGATSILEEKPAILQVEHTDAQLKIRDAKRIASVVLRILFLRVYFSIRYFKVGLSEVPSNWYRVCFERSIFDPPQLVPGKVDAKDVFSKVLDKGAFRFSVADTIFLGSFFLIGGTLLLILGAAALFSAGGIIAGVIAIFALKLLFSGATSSLIAFLYWVSSFLILSLKLTAFFWIPLVYIIYRTPKIGRRTFDDLSTYGKRRTTSLVLVISVIIMLCFAGKIIAPSLLLKFQFLIDGGLIARLVSPKELHLWQVASALNAAIFIGLYYSILDPENRATLRYLTSRADTMIWVQGVFALSSALSCYTILATTLIAYDYLEFMQMPSLSWRLLP